MNVSLPFSGNGYGFFIIIATSSVPAVMGGLILHYITSKPRFEKEKKRRNKQ